MRKNVLGLDLGTNSIGWAIVTNPLDQSSDSSKIEASGVRIIPMDQNMLSDFDTGKLKSQAAERTRLRMVRRLGQRFQLRRERLHRILHLLGFLPPHYEAQIDFSCHFGQFLPGMEPKLAYCRDREDLKPRFLFIDSYHEMLDDFRQSCPELVADGKKIPYDWTIYYLRDKALTRKIEKEELAWLLLHFNQKRGYKPVRGEDEDLDTVKEYAQLQIVKVEAGEIKKGKTEYTLYLSDGGQIQKTSDIPLFDWQGLTREYIVTHKENKKGEKSRSYAEPSENDWTLIKKRTEKQIADSGQTVGSYIYRTLLRKPDQKIRGSLVRTVDRSLYYSELRAILQCQRQFHPELSDAALYADANAELFRSNLAYRRSIQSRDMLWLLCDHTLFYQRPLRSKKSTVGECTYEKRSYNDRQTGEEHRTGVKCVHRSHPLFEEFRLWQFLSNLKIFDRADDTDVTSAYLVDEKAYTTLFDKLREKKEIDQKALLSLFKLKEDTYRWNYGSAKVVLCPATADTAKLFAAVSVKYAHLSESLRESIWHILYSVSDPAELEKALTRFARKQGYNVPAFVEHSTRIKPFAEGYAAYSLRAIKKLLPLMRMGSYWDEALIDPDVIQRIRKIVDGEADDTISTRTREKTEKLRSVADFRGLPLWQACYVVYDRYAETGDAQHWTTPAHIDSYLREFKQYSLRNPVVEQVVTETLRVVRDVWQQYGKPDEIHIELGRELKASNEKRKKLTDENALNAATNVRIKALLCELQKENPQVRPASSAHQERLKLYEQGAIGAQAVLPDDIARISRKDRPTPAEIDRYKCWLDQGYCSPYTGHPIPLARLFSEDYQVDHIIPQARYYDDSLSNKVVCEAAVNAVKKDMLAYEFILANRDLQIELGDGLKATLLAPEQYESFVRQNFRTSKVKAKKLLLTDIPDDFIERQLNDTRYISRFVMGLLSNIVREDREAEATSKNLIPVTGAITTKLKEDWGLSDVWNDLIKDRFVRLNQLTDSQNFGAKDPVSGRFKILVPEQYSKGFSKKRIDHRHHALDAMVIACTTRRHVQFFNNESALSRERAQRDELRNRLCHRNNKRWMFTPPHPRFAKEAKDVLRSIVISFKANRRIINKTTNFYWRFDGGVKKLCRQTSGDNWAVRKPLHKDSVYGRVNLQICVSRPLDKALDTWQQIAFKPLRRSIAKLVAEGYDKKMLKAYFKKMDYQFAGRDISKLDCYDYTDSKEADRLVAIRKPVDESFDAKRIADVTDSAIRDILLQHLRQNNNDPKEAFSPGGLARMNRDIADLKFGVKHKPISKVRLSEALGIKYSVGSEGGKASKFVEGAKGTNLFCAVYDAGEGKRSFYSVPFAESVQNAKDGLPPAPERNVKGEKLLFVLSPLDLVYLPTPDQLERGHIDRADVAVHPDRIYKMVSSSGAQVFFVPYFIASPIADKFEFGPLNKAERSLDGLMIKETAVPLSVDRIGNFRLR